MTSHIKILFAEDHSLFRQLLIPALEEHNIFTIGEAENGLQVMDLLKKKKPDIVLLDIEMPKMNGREVFDKMKVLYPNTKIIILTTYDQDVLRDHYYSKGLSAYITKNTDIDLVAETIRMVHENTYIPTHSLQKKNSAQPGELKFSKRESEMIPLILDGHSNKEIAVKLNIGNKAVEAHKKNLFKKTKTQSAVGFVSYIFKKGLNFLK